MAALALPLRPARRSAPPQTDPSLLAAWQRHGELRRLQRETGQALLRTRREIAQLRLELARLLAAQQSALARAGRNGGFHRWLRAHHIPRATAYRLLAKLQDPAPTAGASCLTPKTETVSPLLEMRGQTLTLHLDPRQTCMFRKYWLLLTEPGATPFHFARRLMDWLEGSLPLPLQNACHAFEIDNCARFTSENCAMVQPLVVLPGQPGAIHNARTSPHSLTSAPRPSLWNQ